MRSLPSILKYFMKPKAEEYELPDEEQLVSQLEEMIRLKESVPSDGAADEKPVQEVKAGQPAMAEAQEQEVRAPDSGSFEQALSLALRNADQRRIKLQAELGLENIRLSQLPEHVQDEAMRQEIKAAGEALSTQYRVLQGAAEVARSALECSLHEVEGMMTQLGFDPVQTKEHTASVSGAHTDFHA